MMFHLLVTFVVVPVLLWALFVKVSDGEKKLRKLESRLDQLAESFRRLKSDTHQMMQRFEETGALSSETEEAEAEDEAEEEAEKQAGLEEPVVEKPVHAPSRPLPSVPHASVSASATPESPAEPEVPASAATPQLLVPGQGPAAPTPDATSTAEEPLGVAALEAADSGPPVLSAPAAPEEPAGVAASEAADTAPPTPPEPVAPREPSTPAAAATPPRATAAPPSDAARPSVSRPPAKPAPAAKLRPPAKPRPPSAFDKWRKQLKEQLAGEGWEAVIGGSWLNKIGSLVTVVGVVLILSWSWANLDPMGRVAMALALSLTLLIAGVVLERRRAYVIVARGFIGTGWAALYVTAYAMHGIETARIIDSPLWGFLVLLAVAIGMILHSLRYRSQTVTGIAYFVAFATLTLTDFTHYAWFASLPLAASLLYVAYRFTWSRMVLMGLLVTYGTFMFRVGGLQASDPLVASWSVGQAVLILYWLMFESFDLLGISKSGPRKDITATIFPLNAAAFLGISLLEWSAINPETLYLFFAMAGAAYVVSAVLRGRLLRDSGLPEGADVLSRALMGSYEGAVSIAAALIVVGIWERYTGLRVGAAWLLEAEIIFLIGLQLRRSFLRWLASIVIALPVIKLVGIDIHERLLLDVMETYIFIWVPLMLLTAAVLYLNRGLLGIAKELDVVPPERVYTYVATSLVVLVLGHEVPVEYLGLALLLFALSLFETGLRSRLAELRYQAYGVGILGSASLVAFNVLGLSLDAERPWLSLIPVALLTYGVAVQLHRLRGQTSSGSGELLLPDGERSVALDFTSVLGTVASASLVWYLLPTYLVPVGWLLLAVPLFEIGLLSGLQRVRYQGYIVAALACSWLLVSHVGQDGLHAARPWLNLVPAALLAYLAAVRLHRLGRHPSGERRLPELERSGVLDVSSVVGTVASASLVWYLLPTYLVPVGWLLLAVPLFEIGLLSGLQRVRYQGYIVAALACSWLLVSHVGQDGLHAARPWLNLVPAALLAYLAAVRLHRLGRHPSGERRLPELERSGVLDVSSVVGTVASASLVWYLLPTYLVPVGWLLLAVPLFEAGLMSSLVRIRYHGYIVSALACGWLLTSHVLGIGLYVERPWLSLIPAALLTYCAATRLFWLGRQQPTDAREGSITDKERSGVLDVATVAGTVAAASLAWYVLPTPLVAVAWGLLGLLLIEVGYGLALPSLRVQGHVLVISAFARVFLANFIGLGATAGISHRILTVVPLIALFYYLNSRLMAEAADDHAAVSDGGTSHDTAPVGLMIRSTETALARAYLYLPAILAVVLIYYEFGPVVAVIGWAALALVLMVLGVRWDREDFRWQAYTLGILVFARSWSSNFYVAGEVFGLPGRLATGVLVATSLYACQLVSPRRRGEGSSAFSPRMWGWFDEHARTFFSLLATTLLTLLIYYEVSTRLLTVAWTLEGTLLLLAGFALRERALRLPGLLLLGACVLKAFLYDFRGLDTIYQILSFIVLGLLMLGISLVYTRYKEQLRRLL